METTYIFDFDSTLIGVESLDELAHIALADRADGGFRLSKLQELTNLGMAGKIPFDESLRRRLDLFSANRSHITLLIDKLMLAITESALRHKDWFAENADNIYIVSGGFKDYIVPVAAKLGIKASHIFANQFVYDDDGSILGYDRKSLLSQPQGKVTQVKALNLNHPVIMVGDGYTDYEVRKAGQADEFWAYTQYAMRPAASENADRVLASFDEVVIANDLLLV